MSLAQQPLASPLFATDPALPDDALSRLLPPPFPPPALADEVVPGRRSYRHTPADSADQVRLTAADAARGHILVDNLVVRQYYLSDLTLEKLGGGWQAPLVTYSCV